MFRRAQRLYPLLALIIMASFLLPPNILAQDTPPAPADATFVASVIVCDTNPGYQVRYSTEALPAGCAPVPGIQLTVRPDLESDRYCNTDYTGSCSLAVPAATGVTVTLVDPGQIPDTTPSQNPIYRAAGDLDGTVIVVRNAPPAVEAPAPPPPSAAVEPQPAQLPAEVPVVEQTSAPVVDAPVVPDPLAPEEGEGVTDVPATVDGTADDATGDSLDATTDPAGKPAPATTDPASNPAPATTDTVTPPAPATTDTVTQPAPATTDTSPVVTSTQSPVATQTPTQTPVPTQAPTQTPVPTQTPTQTPVPTQTPTQVPTVPPTPTPTPVVKTYGTVANTGGGGLRCRTQPNTSSTIITVLADGTKLEARGAASNGWLPVKCAGRDGFMSTQYLSVSQVTENPSTTTPGTTPSTPGYAIVANTGGAGLRCRTQSNTSSSIITVLPEGTRVDTRGAASNGWVPVKCAGRDGYMSTSYANISKPTSPTQTATVTPAPGTSTPAEKTYATVANTGGGGLRCRAQANTGSSIIVVLADGTRVETRGSASGGWLPVKCASRDGFMSTDYLNVGGSSTPTKPPAQTPGATAKTAVVTNTGGAGLNCRVAPGGSVITILSAGARVEVISNDGSWAKVKCGGGVGFAAMAYLSFDGGSSGSPSPSNNGVVWMDVNMSTQYMVVYRGSTVIGQTYVSTGRYPTFETPTGTFYTNWKLRSQTMTGTLGGEYYYVPNVPYVMYFTNVGHAIHGAYWHNNFGARMSHGCINLPVSFAGWLYDISPLGTRIVIHY